MAPPASFNVQEVPRDKGCAATPLRVRVMGGGDGFGGGGGKDGFGGGWFLRGGWFVRGGGGL